MVVPGTMRPNLKRVYGSARLVPMLEQLEPYYYLLHGTVHAPSPTRQSQVIRQSQKDHISSCALSMNYDSDEREYFDQHEQNGPHEFIFDKCT